jgi:hypothetical protein
LEFSLHLKRANVDAADSVKTRTALVEERRRSKARVACTNRRTTQQQRMSQCQAAVVLQRTNQRIGINLVAWTSQITAAVIAAEIIAL